MSAEIWAASFAGVAATSSFVTAVVAIRSLAGQRRDSRDRTRPVVHATLEMAPLGQQTGYLCLLIRNSGASLARDVSISFSPDLPDAEPPASSRTPFAGAWIKERYANAIGLVAPGETLMNTYANLQHGVDPMPAHVEVTASYTDDQGNAWTTVSNLDTTLFDLETHGGLAQDKQSPRVVQAIEEVAFQVWRQRR